MLIQKIILNGFKCFKEKTEIDLSDLTAFIGSNGAGKTAILEALARIFSVDSTQRNIRTNDFNVPIEETLEAREDRTLSIELVFSFPELQEDHGTHSVPEFFNQMVLDGEGELPYCRLRLDALWTKGNTPDGDIEQSLYWINTVEDDFSIEEDTIKATPALRSKIHVHYIPASRDPQKQIKKSANSIMYQLLQGISWSDEMKDLFETSVEEFRTSFKNVNGVKTVQDSLSKMWKTLFKSSTYQSVNLSPINNNFNELLSKIEATFSPSPTGIEENSVRLSDGMKSIFYFSIISCLFDIENKVLNEEDGHGFNLDRFNPPVLTLFAIEEPENHLAPHYLGRIISTFRELINNNRGQVLITSHSPSIIKRVEPEEIRHLRLDSNRETVINSITLPNKRDDAFKYIKEAVKAYPELYFSKLVIFGEGDSEEIVLKRVAEVLDIPIDSSYISIVPLGGRHVNHFWRLLNDIKIPYVTLLDYDRNRGGGAWGRIKYVLNQLIKIGNSPDTLLKTDDGLLDLENLHKAQLDVSSEESWINYLKEYNVFFSYPLDIDFSMFEKFKNAYSSIAPENGGPNIPLIGTDDYEKKCKEAIASVFKKEVKDITDINDYGEIENYFWYRYLFLGRGKPSSHIQALLDISDEVLRTDCPAEISELMDKVNEYIKVSN